MVKSVYVIPGFSPNYFNILSEQIKDFKRRNALNETILVVGENIPKVVFKVTEDTTEEITFVKFIQELLERPVEEDAT